MVVGPSAEYPGKQLKAHVASTVRPRQFILAARVMTGLGHVLAVELGGMQCNEQTKKNKGVGGAGWKG
jgi:hypothetical protein